MRNSKSHFFSLFLFLGALVLLLTNGFMPRIFAQEQKVDIYSAVDPIAVVLDEILDNYVKEPDLSVVVEGALKGMMSELDDHCSYIPADVYTRLKEDTEGEFEGVGIHIQLDADKTIQVMHVIPNSPAAKAGVLPEDRIIRIDGVSTRGMSLDEARDRIRGARGTAVTLSVFRVFADPEKEAEELDFSVKRDTIPLQSVVEARLLDNGIGYVRISDFKNNTAEDLSKALEEMNKDNGLKGLVLDLRWNPGGLLSASKDVAELFLPNNTLVTYTKGRDTGSGTNFTEDLKLYTERPAIVPEKLPIVILTNNLTASAAEIVTGALQYWARAVVVGDKTYGKGSVQTIIPLTKPANSALRLTTALYYTPAGVTIDKRGIMPDVEEPMDMDHQKALIKQMVESYRDDMSRINRQNHGTVTGDPASEALVEDTQLQRAVQILTEAGTFEKLIKEYHKDPKVTQVAAIPDEKPVDAHAEAAQ